MIDIKSKNTKLFAEINITPLTDVALVLLIIFMITAPMIMQSGIGVKLPGAVTSDFSPEKNIIIDITADGRIFLFGKQELTLDQLFLPLSADLLESKSKTVVINADKAVAHGVVVSVMDISKQAGADKLYLSTELKAPEWKK
jgi:biopolymer transport protein ExbD